MYELNNIVSTLKRGEGGLYQDWYGKIENCYRGCLTLDVRHGRAKLFDYGKDFFGRLQEIQEHTA